MDDHVFEAKCPQCKEPQRCPCPSCRDKNKGKIVWIWNEDDTISCGNCELTLGCDDWELLASKQLKDFAKGVQDSVDIE